MKDQEIQRDELQDATLSQRGPRDALYMYESMATVTATFPEIVNGHLLRSIVLKCVLNLKFVALLAPR